MKVNTITYILCNRWGEGAVRKKKHTSTAWKHTIQHTYKNSKNNNNKDKKKQKKTIEQLRKK